jgi:hypothetical protein
MKENGVKGYAFFLLNSRVRLRYEILDIRPVTQKALFYIKFKHLIINYINIKKIIY